MQVMQVMQAMQSVESWVVIKDIVVVLSAALAFGLVFERFGVSAMLGYLVAGTVIGASGFELVAQESVTLAAEIGVALLLFTIGLETSWSRFRAIGAVAAGGGTLQIIATTAVVAGGALLFGEDWRVAVVVGFAVSLSSTATVIQSLQARGEQDSLHGRASLGVLLLQDGAVVPLVLLTSFLGQGGTITEMLQGVSLAAGRAFLLVVVLIFIGARLMPRLLTATALARSRELPILLAVVSCLAATYAAHSAGLSAALGAFVAGMILADSPLAVQIRSDVGPLRAILVTLFFASVGMQADLNWLITGTNWLLVFGLVATVVVVKAVIVTGVLSLFGAARTTAVATGLCLSQIGEFSFVLASEARGSGLFSERVFQAVAAATLVTLLITPILVSNARRLARRITGPDSTPLSGPRADDSPHVLLVGYGPAALEAIDQLRDAELSVTVVDTNPRLIESAVGAGHRGYVGDAARPEVLEHAGLHSALAVVITVPDHIQARQIIAEVRALRPHVTVITRARYHRFADGLRFGPEETVVDEEEAVGRLLGFEAYLAAAAAQKMAAGTT